MRTVKMLKSFDKKVIRIEVAPDEEDEMIRKLKTIGIDVDDCSTPNF